VIPLREIKPHSRHSLGKQVSLLFN
jgi:hypothetical protein